MIITKLIILELISLSPFSDSKQLTKFNKLTIRIFLNQKQMKENTHTHNQKVSSLKNPPEKRNTVAIYKFINFSVAVFKWIYFPKTNKKLKYRIFYNFLLQRIQIFSIENQKPKKNYKYRHPKTICDSSCCDQYSSLEWRFLIK